MKEISITLKGMTPAMCDQLAWCIREITKSHKHYKPIKQFNARQKKLEIIADTFALVADDARRSEK